MPRHHPDPELRLPHSHKPREEIKLNIQKTKIMASGPITSWHLVPSLQDGETVETVTDFIFGGSKITAEDRKSIV